MNEQAKSLFSCDKVTDPEIRGKLDRISASVKSLALPPLCLPNIHPKAGLESPPQFVAATLGTIVPQLSAPAMNCGMSVFKTTLSREDFSESFLKEFAARLRRGVSARKGKFRAALEWLCFPTNVRSVKSRTFDKGYDISKSELEDFFLYGAKAAVGKYNLPETELDHMEYRGDVLEEQEKNSINFKNLVPRSSYINGRHEMGYNFGGNHFLEFHYVEGIKDAETARAWGISQNQILMFYHGGGGHATYHLGRYFGRREKNTPQEKFILFFLKFFFHFGSWEGVKNFSARWKAYFSRRPFPEIPLNSAEGARLMQSIKIALNYGYAFRTALLRRIKDALSKGDAAFLWDAAHNSIMQENIGGQDLIVHRQDAMRVSPGKPVMVAGFNTLSYLGIGQEGAITSLFSSTPSAGKTIAKYKKEGLSRPDPEHFTLVSKRKEKEIKREEGITSEGLFAVVRELEEAGIVKPVAYLRPMGLIKGH